MALNFLDKIAIFNGISLLVGLKFIQNVSEVKSVKFVILSIVLSTIGMGGLITVMAGINQSERDLTVCVNVKGLSWAR